MFYFKGSFFTYNIFVTSQLLAETFLKQDAAVALPLQVLENKAT
jgi:hypothetical protein